MWMWLKRFWSLSQILEPLDLSTYEVFSGSQWMADNGKIAGDDGLRLSVYIATDELLMKHNYTLDCEFEDGGEMQSKYLDCSRGWCIFSWITPGNLGSIGYFRARDKKREGERERDTDRQTKNREIDSNYWFKLESRETSQHEGGVSCSILNFREETENLSQISHLFRHDSWNVAINFTAVGWR